LISKLRKYEELHRKCGPHLTLELPIKRWKSLQISKERKNSTNSAATTCKYIIWLPANGLANQIISMAHHFFMHF
jgi:xyloglucan fucosyltransferase